MARAMRSSGSSRTVRCATATRPCPPTGVDLSLRSGQAGQHWMGNVTLPTTARPTPRRSPTSQSRLTNLPAFQPSTLPSSPYPDLRPARTWSIIPRSRRIDPIDRPTAHDIPARVSFFVRREEGHARADPPTPHAERPVAGRLPGPPRRPIHSGATLRLFTPP